MKVITKSNNYIAIPTAKKSECVYQLGQYLNKKNCIIEMSGEKVEKIICSKFQDESGSKWNKTITLETEIPYKTAYIILDLEGNLVDVVTKEQFDNKYAILQED